MQLKHRNWLAFALVAALAVLPSMRPTATAAMTGAPCTGTCLSDVLEVGGNAAAWGPSCNTFCWVGGDGAFSSGDPNCAVYWSDDLETSPTCGVGGFYGTFVSTACGTFTADGAIIGLTEGDDSGLPGRVNFHIDFFGGVGVLQDAGGSGEQGAALNTVDPATFAGAVYLAPPEGIDYLAPNPNAVGFGPCMLAFDLTSLLVVADGVAISPG